MMLIQLMALSQVDHVGWDRVNILLVIGGSDRVASRKMVRWTLDISGIRTFHAARTLRMQPRDVQTVVIYYLIVAVSISVR